MLAVIASQLEHNPALEAFSEETSFLTLDIARGVESLFDELRNHDKLKLVAGDHGAVEMVQQLRCRLGRPASVHPDWLFDRARQFECLGIPYLLVRNRGDLENALKAYDNGLTLRPRQIGNRDSELVCTADGLIQDVSGQSCELIARPFSAEPRLVVDTVSSGGHHATSDVAALRVDERAGALYLRHRISLLDDDPQAVAAESTARHALDKLEVQDGASQTELVFIDGNWRVSEIRSGPHLDGASADASFRAYGYSHWHLYCESILRPAEFQRRITLPPKRRRNYLAASLIWSWPGQQPEGIDGLRLLRRLTGYHDISILSNIGKSGVKCIASFVHEDRPFIENSLKILHEMEDSGSFFRMDNDFIAYAPSTRGQIW